MGSIGLIGAATTSPAPSGSTPDSDCLELLARKKGEKEVEEIGKLRIFYYERSNKLERLFLEFRDDSTKEDDARSQLFALRDAAIEIEELDTKLNIKKHRKLFLKADTLAKKHLNQYYNE